MGEKCSAGQREREKETVGNCEACINPPVARNCGAAAGARRLFSLGDATRLNELRYGAVVCSEGHGHNNESAERERVGVS